MKRVAVALSVAGLVTGCASPAHNMDRVQPGMTPQQVSAIVGQPQAMTYSAGKQCSYFVLLKDFWSRVPWRVNDRYYVCYDDGRVESFGKVDTVTEGL
ncbi:MAG: outer membrane protein assembly factor BamE [Alphaproteobacteria bacterium]|nr:outer membrane protein assembly factor BamE [Alphaproteobacteria bacterium]MBV8407286.1 outer membrane protein assembly factor BamE [Alphaproteobacteria bacterium]